MIFMTFMYVWWSPSSVKLELLFCNTTSCLKYSPALLHVSSTLCPSNDNHNIYIWRRGDRIIIWPPGDMAHTDSHDKDAD